MVTSAPLRWAAGAVVAFAFAGPAVLLGGAAWAEPTPAPATTSVDELVAPPDEPEAPATQPTVGTWIIGGSAHEGSAPVVAPKPVVKPVVQPAVGAPRVATARTSTRTHSHATTRTSTRSQVTRPSGSTGGPATAPDGALALPFTGGPEDVLLPVGAALLVSGMALTFAARPRPALASRAR